MLQRLSQSQHDCSRSVCCMHHPLHFPHEPSTARQPSSPPQIDIFCTLQPKNAKIHRGFCPHSVGKHAGTATVLSHPAEPWLIAMPAWEGVQRRILMPRWTSAVCYSLRATMSPVDLTSWKPLLPHSHNGLICMFFSLYPGYKSGWIGIESYSLPSWTLGEGRAGASAPRSPSASQQKAPWNRRLPVSVNEKFNDNTIYTLTTVFWRRVQHQCAKLAKSSRSSMANIPAWLSRAWRFAGERPSFLARSFFFFGLNLPLRTLESEALQMQRRLWNEFPSPYFFHQSG